MADEAHERIHIDAPVDVCFDLATDFEGYPAWTSDVKHARVVERGADGDSARADFRAAALGRSVRYVLDYDLSDAPRSFSWQLVEGDMLRTLEGRYTFDDVDEGTDVTYDLSVDLAVPLPGLVKRRAAGRIVGAALQDLKHAAEARVAVATAPGVGPEPVVVVEPEPDAEPVAPEPVAPEPGAPEPVADAAPQGTDYDRVGTEERSLPLPPAIEVVISELLGAVPEVRDHLLAAADELLDAAKAMLDAADRVVRQHREGELVTRATLGIDLGGTNLRAGVIDTTGALVADHRLPTPSTLEGIVASIAALARALADEHDVASCLGIGAAGMITFDGVIRYAPNVPPFVEAPVAQLVRDALDMPVALDNDANVAALAELTHGAARGHAEVLCITLGTGVGGGIITGGRVLRGAHGFAAEVGHFQIDPNGPMCACGERGHWEAIASGTALGRLGRESAAAGEAPSVLARANGVVDDITGVHVGDAAQAGEADALALVHEYAHGVALGLVGLVNILDSELVVISGGLVELGDVLLGPLREFFDGHLEGARHRPAVDIIPAALGERAGVIGAGVLARGLVGT